MTDHEYKFLAFLCYSPQDNLETRSGSPAVASRCWGDWLHAALNAFSIPAEFIGQINGRGELIPERMDSIFREDPHPSDDAPLSPGTRQALDQSNCLVVICSPRSAKSLRVNEIVRYFKQLGRGKHIFPIVIAGEPYASQGDQPGRSPDDECFVPALRHPVSPDGSLDTARRAGKFAFVDARHGAGQREIVAGDDRNAEADLEMARIHLIALLLGVGFNGLWWREQKRHFFDVAEARQQAREARNQVAEVRRQLSEAREQALQAQKQSLELQNLPRDVHGQIQEAQSQALTAQNQAHEARRQLEELQNKIRESQAQLEEARTRARAAENKVLEAQQAAQEIRNQLEAARGQARDAENKVQELQSQAVPEQVQDAQNQILKARSEAQEAQTRIEEFRQQAQAAQDKSVAAQRQVEELSNQARIAAGQLEEARQQVRVADDKASAAQAQALEAQKQIQEIRIQTRDSQSRIDAAQNQVRQIQGQSLAARRLTRVFAVLAALALLAAAAVARRAWQQHRMDLQSLARATAEASGKFDPAAAGLDRDQILKTLQNIGGAEQDANRRQSLAGLAAAVPPSELIETLKASSVIVPDQQRSSFQKALLIRLGLANPPAAMTNATAIPGKIVNEDGAADSNGYFQLAVLDNWMKSDLTAAFNWVCASSSADVRPRALAKIISALASQPDSGSKNQMLEVCVRALVKTDIVQAWTIAESLPEGAWRNTVISSLAGQFDPDADLKAAHPLDQLPETIVPVPWTSFLLNANGRPTIVPVGPASDATNSPVQTPVNE